MPRNPFQDRINALNMKDLEEGLKTDAYLKKSHDPIPNDINDTVFAYTDIKQVNTLKPEELSMKDLLDEIQIQTILNNNISPYVKKEIKSEVTQEMIKQFQYESSKPVEINGRFYKFRPPGVDLNLQAVPPPFPSEDDYKRSIRTMYEQELKAQRDIERRRVILLTDIRRLDDAYDDGRLSRDEYQKAVGQFNSLMGQIDDARQQNDATLASLFKDYDMYDELKLAHDTQVELITKENKKNLASYEDELKSRNTGMEVSQQPGESDSDYAQRMIDMGQETVDPAQVEAQAKLFLYNSVKDLTNELMPPYKSEAVLNTIVQAGGYEKLQIIKDSWPSLKKLLVDTFGNVGRVESTDNIAQLMYNYSMKPVVRPPQSSPSSAPLQSSPTVIPTSSTLPSYSATTPPSISSYMTKYKNPVEVYATAPYPPSRPAPTLYNPRQITTAPASYSDIEPLPRALVPTASAYPARPKAKEVSKENVRFYPKEKKKSPIKSVTLVKDIPKKSEMPPPPPRLTRSSSLKAQSEKIPIDLITNDDLIAILEEKGLPYLTGHSRESKEKNYTQALSANLIPKRPQLEPRSVVAKMPTSELKRYLESKGVRGSNGGLPSKQADRDLLLKMYDRYATPELRASGLKPLDAKAQFEIINGEIEAGNNNPQLLRDARKLLKEFVQQKMVTIYEAKTHMKHLRKINKI